MTTPRIEPERHPPREVTLSLAGTQVVLRGDRTMYWPAMRWLIVADLHLGKAESLRRDGVALPDAVTAADLARLRLAVAETSAVRVLVLGDLIHDAAGLTSALVRRVAAWRDTIDGEIALIPGNHDRRVAGLPAAWRMETLAAELHVAPFHFSHEPRAAARAFNWHGHIHPVRTLRGGVDRARLPVFAVHERAGILPAFSTLTGGSECAPDDAVQHWAIADGRVLALAPSRDRSSSEG